MIKLTGHSGMIYFVAVSNIASITEAAASSQWHGIKSIIKLHTGATLEVQQTAGEVYTLITQVKS